MQPAENLRTILDFGNRLSTTLELDQLLPKIGDGIFGLYKQAERCFLILQDEATGELGKEVTWLRRPDEEKNPRCNRAIVRQCLDRQQAFLSADPAGDKEPTNRDSADMPVRSVMCTPFFSTDNKPLGAIQLDTLDRARKFTAHDLKLFAGLANQASLAVQNARVYQEMQKREQIERDLELAAQVQRSILPEQLPQIPGYQFFKKYASALQVGGDYFDFIPLPQQRLAITLGDVAGKSVPAAILMAKLSSDVRTSLLAEAEPAEALTHLNRLLYRTLQQTDRWITFAAALLDAPSHVVTLVNAGHCTPLLYRYGQHTLQEAIPNDLAGVPLGVMESPYYGSCRVKLEPGDSLVLYTDGVPDALDAENKQFRLDGIYAILQGTGPLTARALGERIVKAVEQHAAGHSQYDDITLVSFGRVI